jgi:archaetidylinositol phosphate synthase
VTADRVSVFALLLGGILAPLLVLGGRWTLATATFILGDFADYVDGDVARAQGTASDRGDILDGVIDRYVDALILSAMTLSWAGSDGGSALLMSFGGDEWLPAAVGLMAIFGALMPSYVRAVASANGATTPESIAGRGTRNLIVVLSLAAHEPGWGVAAIAAIGNVAAFHRLAAALRRPPAGPGATDS